MSVVKSRSLPQVEDGLKPVQRRILYAMRGMGITPSSKHIKVARVVGDTMGKFHPHGDASIGEAMVRMAQPFTLRYPLIDGQGNFGSRDGDGAAAARYIEARLSPIAELMLSEIDQGTVDFVPNYDGAFIEPALLPARLPFVLLNGAKGPAVGYRPEVPPHNLREVVAATCLLLRNERAGLDDLLAVLKAPDFPGGGQIISPAQAIREAYESGRGAIRMRARWRREELARGQWRLVVNELPHGVSTSQVISEIESITNPQPRSGKKEVSQEQKNLKTLLLSVIDVVRDESCEAEPVRLVIEPKSSKQTEDETMGPLLAHTGLECSIPINLVMIGLDGNPGSKGLVQILREWIEFRFITVERRTRHRLQEIERRVHILEGRKVVLDSIDAVIGLIRDSDEPRKELIERFHLSELQADDILELRLRQLARLEGLRIEQEIAQLSAERTTLSKLVDASDGRRALRALILKELESDSSKYGDDRRTLVLEVQPIRPAVISVPEEPVTVILSKNGWIRSRQGHGVDEAAIAYKSGDERGFVIETMTTSSIVLLDTNGRAYSIRVSDIPGGRGDGVPVTTLVELQPGENGAGRIVHCMAAGPESRWLFSGSGGYGFVTTLSELIGRNRAGKAFMTIEKGETVLAPAPIQPESTHVLAISRGPKEHRLLVFPIDEMKTMPKGRGVTMMALNDGEALMSVAVGSGDSAEISGAPSTLKIGSEELRKHILHRARKGCQLPPKFRPTGIVKG
jgi:topoisomerase-4 subunit A